MLKDFDFCLSTHFIFGKDAELKVGDTIKANGASTVMLLHDPGEFLYTSGLLSRVMSNLEQAGLRVIEAGEVKPNPLISYAEKLARICKEEKVNYLVSLGGGSVIDTAKCVSAMVAFDGPVEDLFRFGKGKADPARVIPHAVILTNPATGSESAFTCVMDNDVTRVKAGLTGGGPFLRPNYCFMNPELSYSLPPRATGAGIVDMFSHIAERYFCNDASFGLIDYMAEGAMRYLGENAVKCVEDGTNYDVRSNVMYAGSVAHNDTLGVGRAKDMGSHDIAHALSALYDTPHGITMAMIMPCWMRHIYRRDVERFSRWAVQVWGVEDGADKNVVCLKGIEAFENWCLSLRCPIGFAGANIPADRAEQVIAKAFNPHKPLGRCYPLSEDDIRAIVNMSAAR